MTSTAPFDTPPLAQTVQSAPKWWSTEPHERPERPPVVSTTSSPGGACYAYRGRTKKTQNSVATAPLLGGAKFDRLNPMLEVANLTAQLYKLQREGKPLAAGDRVFDFFEESFEGGAQDISVCDLAIREVDVTRLSDTVLVAILAVTAPARDYLPSRPGFLNRVRAQLAITNPDEANLVAESYE